MTHKLYFGSLADVIATTFVDYLVAQMPGMGAVMVSCLGIISS